MKKLGVRHVRSPIWSTFYAGNGIIRRNLAKLNPAEIHVNCHQLQSKYKYIAGRWYIKK